MTGTGSSPPTTVRELEHALRGLGYSKGQARAIASDGFKAIHSEPDISDEASEQLEVIAARFKHAASILKGDANDDDE